ncbi:MAG: hypothetical protein ACI8W3_002465 [Myxococcota bacterium]|jgi:hypothetical protein
MALVDELKAIGKRLGEREAKQASRREELYVHAHALHARVREGLEGFSSAGKEAGADHLVVELSTPRIDEKHLHAVQFDVARGRHCLIVTVKPKGEVTLVGPFKTGKPEGPCRSLALDDEAGVEAGLSEVLAEFLEAAFAP